MNGELRYGLTRRDYKSDVPQNWVLFLSNTSNSVVGFSLICVNRLGLVHLISCHSFLVSLNQFQQKAELSYRFLM